MAADAIDEALTNNDVSAKQFEGYGAKLCQHIEHMREDRFTRFTMMTSASASLSR